MELALKHPGKGWEGRGRRGRGGDGRGGECGMMCEDQSSFVGLFTVCYPRQTESVVWKNDCPVCNI